MLAVLAIGAAIARRRPRLGPVLQLRRAVPEPARAALRRRSPAPAATTSGGSRSTPSAKSRSLGHGAGTYQFSWDQLRSISIPVHDAHSLYLEAFAELGLIGGLLVLGAGRRRCSGPASPPGGRRAGRAAGAATRCCSPSALAFAVGAGDRLVLGDRRARRDLLPRRRRPGRGPLRPARPRPRRGRRPGRAAALRPRGRRPGARLDHRPGADRAAAGRPRDRRQPGGGRRRQHRQRRRPRRHRPLDRALGGLPLRPARPAGRVAGRLRDRRRAAHPGDRPRGPQLAALLPAGARSSTRRGDAAAAEPTCAEAQQLNPLKKPACGKDGTAADEPHAGHRAQRRRPPSPRGARAAPAAAAAGRLGLTGADGSRRRGALLRRLLAARRLGGAARPRSASSPPPPRAPTSRPSSGRSSSAPPGSSWSSSTASTTTTTGGSATAPSTSCPRWSRPASSAPSSSTACWRSARSGRSRPPARSRVGVGALLGSFVAARRPALPLAPPDRRSPPGS